MVRGSPAILMVALVGCTGGDGETHGVTPPTPTECDADEVALVDGSCVSTGIGSNGCAAGFAHDGAHGCEPILPSEPCLPGEMALPGETACREVAPCGDGTWGDIPVEADTVYVDGSYAGSDSDGSAPRPWPTIDAGIIDAMPGAIVAVAAGSYHEDVDIVLRPVSPPWCATPSPMGRARTAAG